MVLEEECSAIISSRYPDVACQVEHKGFDTIKYMKLKKEISGLAGADCLLCEHKQSTWENEEQVISRFKITTTAELIVAISQQLVTPGGEILQTNGQFV